MLRNISWQSFLTILVIAVAIYYVAILFKFYVPVWVVAIKGKKRSVPLHGDQQNTGVAVAAPAPADYFKLTETIVSKLKEIVAKVISDSAERTDQLKALQVFLQQYVHLKGTAYAAAITNALAREFTSSGQPPLSASEADLIWSKT